MMHVYMFKTQSINLSINQLVMHQFKFSKNLPPNKHHRRYNKYICDNKKIVY